MKKINSILALLFSCYVLFFSVSVQAQDYIPLLREDVYWRCLEQVEPHFTGNDAIRHNLYTIVIKGDTIVKERTYKKCYYIFDDSVELQITPVALMREDIEQKRIYKYPNQLVYDFKDLTNPDQCWAFFIQDLYCDSVCHIDDLSIDSVWTTEIDGVAHPSYQVGSGGNWHRFIEGVGPAGSYFYESREYPCDVINPVFEELVGYINYRHIFLHMCDSTGRIIYDAPAEIEDYISSSAIGKKTIERAELKLSNVSNRLNITGVQGDGVVEVYNTCGQIVYRENVTAVGNDIILTHDLSSGFYIIKIATETATETFKVKI